MNRRGRSWSALAASLVLAAVLPSQAAEANAGPTAKPSPEPDALTRAQRDFDTIKATRNGTLLPARPDVPRVAVPEWQGVPAPTPSIPLKSPASEAKSPTWLIDAMKKETASSESRTTGSDERGRDPRLSTNAGSSEKELSAAARTNEPDSRETRERNDRSASVRVVNPLERYLGDWMTPQDYALLKPGLAESLGERTDVKRETTAFDATTIAGGLAGIAGGASPASPLSVPGGSSAPLARENPYLQSLVTPPVITIAPPPRAPSPAPVFAPPATLGTPAVNAPSPARIPDFARPANDEKYFKQLKRF
ncbi:hypothetical protein [Horticoccus sp. 23ND18S-11]|uniref:hypothetical protein n=1 Tax=Horticoccus sp. 23ND18S-11 TaxID=3391832 RepID=UPI0039C8C172